MNLDLASILSDINNTNTSISDGINSIVQNNQRVQDLTEDATNQIKRVGALNGVVAGAEGLAELDAQNNARRAAVSLGTNMDSANEVITALGMTARDSSIEAMNTLAQIKQKESVGFLDDPLQWVVNQFSLDSDYTNYNNAVEQHNQASAALADLNNQTQQTVVTQNAIAAKVTEGTIAAKVEQAKISAQILADDNAIKGFAANTQSITQTLALQGQQLQNHLAARQVFNSDREFALRQQEFEQNKRTADINFKLAQKKLDNVNADEADQKNIADTINVARSQMNLPSLGVKEIQRTFKLGGSVAEDLRNQYLIGASSMDTGKAIIATRPSEAIAVLARNKGKLQSPVIDNFVKSLPSTAMSAEPQIFPTLKPAQQAQKIDEVAKNIAMSSLQEIRPNDSQNIYQLPPTGTIVNSAELQKSVLYNKILKPILDVQQVKNIDPAKIVDLAAQHVANGDVKFEQVASDLDTYFAQAKTLNNDFNNYEQIGLPPQNQINVRVNQGAFNNKVMDLSNPAQVRLYLMRKSSPTFRMEEGIAYMGQKLGVLK